MKSVCSLSTAIELLKEEIEFCKGHNNSFGRQGIAVDSLERVLEFLQNIRPYLENLGEK